MERLVVPVDVIGGIFEEDVVDGEGRLVRDCEEAVGEPIFDIFGLGFLFPVAKRYAFRLSISSFSPVIRNFAVFIICNSGWIFPFSLVKPSVGLSSCGNHRH